MPTFPPSLAPLSPIRKRLARQLLTWATSLLLGATACSRAPQPPPVVLFDQGHGQRFLMERDGELDLSLFKTTLERHGLTVRASDHGLTRDTLQGVSTLIVSGPFAPFSETELTLLHNFLEGGGQLCVLLHIASPAAPLLNSLGVAVSNGVIQHPDQPLDSGKPTDFFVSEFAPHPLTKGLARISLYGAWALDTQLPANVLASTGPRAWIDLNQNAVLDQADAVQTFNVMVTGQLGHGRFVVIGDDAVLQNRFVNGGNQQLADNLARWFKEGSYYR